jgi:hypothetical protein
MAWADKPREPCVSQDEEARKTTVMGALRFGVNFCSFFHRKTLYVRLGYENGSY